MKRNLLLLTLITISSLTVFNSCGDKEDTTPDDTKTLDKSKLYDKGWYFQGETYPTHTFKSNGVYNINGTWEWLNGGDSMHITSYAGGNIEMWYFNYCTDDEMSCKTGVNGGEKIYKSSPW